MKPKIKLILAIFLLWTANLFAQIGCTDGSAPTQQYCFKSYCSGLETMTICVRYMACATNQCWACGDLVHCPNGTCIEYTTCTSALTFGQTACITIPLGSNITYLDVAETWPGDPTTYTCSIPFYTISSSSFTNNPSSEDPAHVQMGAEADPSTPYLYLICGAE